MEWNRVNYKAPGKWMPLWQMHQIGKEEKKKWCDQHKNKNANIWCIFHTTPYSERKSQREQLLLLNIFQHSSIPHPNDLWYSQSVSVERYGTHSFSIYCLSLFRFVSSHSFLFFGFFPSTSSIVFSPFLRRQPRQFGCISLEICYRLSRNQ